MNTNTIKAVLVLSMLSTSTIASALSTVYTSDITGFMGFLNVLLHTALSLAPLFLAIAMIHIVHYFYIGRRQKIQSYSSDNIPAATSIDRTVANRKPNRASQLAPPSFVDNEDLSDSLADKESPLGRYAFLDEYKDVKRQYARVINLYARVKNSDMSLMLKQRADGLKATAEKTLDTLRSICKLGPATPQNLMDANSKLSDVISALDDMIKGYQDDMAAEFDNIKISDTYKQQDELEKLRKEGQMLLSKIKNDSNFDISEDKFRLDKIVNERLDQVWRDYTTAKRKYYAPAPSGTLLVTDQRSSLDPDAALNNVFMEIKSIYSDIELGVKTQQKETSMRDLLANKNYFENR